MTLFLFEPDAKAMRKFWSQLNHQKDFDWQEHNFKARVSELRST